MTKVEDRQTVAALRGDLQKKLIPLTVCQAPSARFPPQRVARGLIVLQCAAARLTPGEPRNFGLSDHVTYLEHFDILMGASPSVLQEDTQLANLALRFIGVELTPHTPVGRVQMHEL